MFPTTRRRLATACHTGTAGSVAKLRCCPIMKLRLHVAVASRFGKIFQRDLDTSVFQHRSTRPEDGLSFFEERLHALTQVGRSRGFFLKGRLFVEPPR